MNIIGRLTRDAQISTLPGDKQVVNFSVAVNDSYRNKKGERVELTEYFNCAYWISTNVAKLLTKGTLVELMGRVSARAWISNDGEAHAALNFHTSQIKLHGSGKRSETVAGGISNNSIVPANNRLSPKASQRHSFPRRRKAVAQRNGAATYPKPVPVHLIPCNPFCATGCGTNYYVIVVAFNHF